MDEFRCLGIAVDDEDPRFLESLRLGRDEHFFWIAQAEPGSAGEGAAFPQLAFGPDIPTHHLDEFVDDAQTKTGSPVFSRHRIVALGKGLEQLPQMVLRHSDAGVPNRETQFHPFLRLLEKGNLQFHFPGFCEFHCVADEVDKDLLYSVGITHKDSGDVGGDSDDLSPPTSPETLWVIPTE